MRGERPDPYRVWLSEIMLQQTVAAHVAPYFQRFVERWPEVGALADAGWEEVSAAWAGLGYYSRARNLHACAKLVAGQGGFPQDRDGLKALPGVGPYTSAAIAAIAFGEKVAPVDGNIERVVSRLFAIGSDGTQAGWRAAKKEIAGRAQEMFDALPDGIDASDTAQALMDLGQGVCRPKTPLCDVCPLADWCAGRAEGAPERYPVKAAKAERPQRVGVAFVGVRGDEVLLVRRPERGLLGGMLMPPSTEWVEGEVAGAMAAAPFAGAWERVGEVRHVFTHFSLKLDVMRAEAGASDAADGEWVEARAAKAALPSVGRKAVALALGD